jgi:hypothetical protein
VFSISALRHFIFESVWLIEDKFTEKIYTLPASLNSDSLQKDINKHAAYLTA